MLMICVDSICAAIDSMIDSQILMNTTALDVTMAEKQQSVDISNLNAELAGKNQEISHCSEIAQDLRNKLQRETNQLALERQRRQKLAGKVRELEKVAAKTHQKHEAALSSKQHEIMEMKEGLLTIERDIKRESEKYSEARMQLEFEEERLLQISDLLEKIENQSKVESEKSDNKSPWLRLQIGLLGISTLFLLGTVGAG
jgi:hypothetical protein